MNTPLYIFFTSSALPVVEGAGKKREDAEGDITKLVEPMKVGDSKPFVSNVHVTFVTERDWGSVAVAHLEGEDVERYKLPPAA